MKKKPVTLLIICGVVLLLVCGVCGVNDLLSDFADSSNIVCEGQQFASAEEAIKTMEKSAREANDTSLDYCPPYRVVHSFEYEDHTIVLYSYCYTFDGVESGSYAVRILKHNDNGTLSFEGGFADFRLKEPDGTEDLYYFTNIHTSRGKKSISFLWLPKDSEKDIYVDGVKAEKELISVDDGEFYICYAVSHRDTILSALFTPISDRHRIEIK